MQKNLFIDNDIVNEYSREDSKRLVTKLINTKEFKILEEYLLSLKMLSKDAISNLSNNLQADQVNKILYKDIWFGIFGIHKNKEFQYRTEKDFGKNLHIEISKYEKFELKLRFWKPMPCDPIESTVQFQQIDFQINLACSNGNELYFLDITDYYDLVNEKWHREIFNLFTWESSN